MSLNVTHILLQSRLAGGSLVAGEEIALRIDQALLQDVLGTLVMLELEAMDADRIQIGVAAQYIDHNLLEADNLNSDEHLFLRSSLPSVRRLVQPRRQRHQPSRAHAAAWKAGRHAIETFIST